MVLTKHITRLTKCYQNTEAIYRKAKLIIGDLSFKNQKLATLIAPEDCKYT